MYCELASRQLYKHILVLIPLSNLSKFIAVYVCLAIFSCCFDNDNYKITDDFVLTYGGRIELKFFFILLYSKKIYTDNCSIVPVVFKSRLWRYSLLDIHN